MLLININPVDKNFIDEELKNTAIIGNTVDKKNFNGQTELISYILPLSTLTVPIIAKIIIEYIKSRKQIEVKYRGLEIRGLNERNTVKILQRLIENEKNQ